MGGSFWAGWLILVPLTLLAQEPALPVPPNVAVDGVLPDRNAEYGDPADPKMLAFLARISPLTNVARLKTPVFIAAGAKDTRPTTSASTPRSWSWKSFS